MKTIQQLATEVVAKRLRVSTRIRDWRAEIIYSTWEKYKGSYTMVELADVFRLTVAQIHGIIKEEKENYEQRKRVQGGN